METESTTGTFTTVPVAQGDLDTSNSLLSPSNMFRTSSLPPDPPPENTAKLTTNAHNGRVQPHHSMDLVEDIKGMYRLLDLISEPGRNDSVDKIIIAADSLKRFINAMRPGAFTALTKIDFKTLDGPTIKPIGIYGSKVEIVRFLRSLDAVSEDVARLLLLPTEHDSVRPALSSGLYVIVSGHTNIPLDHHYVLYWPEDSTWDDSAPSSVCQNRVMFMRYLTKLCDQVVALLSAEHSASIVWDEDYDDTESIDMDFGDEDRLFTYKVRKRGQETTVASRPGFQMNSTYISRGAPPADGSADPSIFVPTLLHGEVAQGFWTASYVPPKTRTTTLYQHPCDKLYLKQLLEANSLVLSEYLRDEAVRILVDEVISNTFPKQCDEWRSATTDTRKSVREEMIRTQEEACQDLISQETSLRRALLDAVVDDVVKLFPSIERDELLSKVGADLGPDINQVIPHRTRVDNLRQLYRGFDSLYRRHVEDAKFGVVKGPEFAFLKERLTFLRHLLKERRDISLRKRKELIQTLLSEDDIRNAKQVIPKPDNNKPARRSSLVSRFTAVSPWPKGTDEELLRKEMKIANSISDANFLLDLKGMDDEDLKAPSREAVNLAHTELSLSIDATVKKMAHAVLQMQQDERKKSIQQQVEAAQEEVLHGVLVNFIRDINKNSAGRRTSVVYIDDVQQGERGDGSSSPGYKVTGRIDVLEEPKLEFQVYLMDLAGNDKANMQTNPKHVLNPVVSDKRSGVFHLPLGLRIVFHRLLENERLLLVLADEDKYAIYLKRLAEMNATIQRAKPIKTFKRSRIGEDVLFAYDEAKRKLVVYASAKMKLHAFVFDKTFRTIQSQGSSINLALWYSHEATSIVQLCFVCGRDEVALVDSSAQVKIFSFVTQQIGPVSLQLPSLPNVVYSSPDGSCLLALQTQGSQQSLTAYRLETFGSANQMSLQLPTFPLDGAVVTSMVSRGHIFLLTLDVDTQCIRSVAIDIASKVAGFTFREKGSKYAPKHGADRTQHNSLLDCHKEVWTRFAVLPSVKRRTITSLSERRPRTLTFITETPTQPFAPYFSDLIQGFVKETRKPTGNELYSIQVSATDFKSFWDNTALNPSWDVSQCRLGEWLVDLLCLIPIHIAVCRTGVFVPLVDGAISAEADRSLRGADVNQIVDKLSLGWYESIFQSYMASKPVKVVSSVGPQAVGKSFLLDHLVGTSFGAMRTTEGVWMSVTPTDEELIVALDFEGLDSGKRSLQEASFLVLFNTAVSNLVLFRNNFSLDQNIGGLFQPFQSSASIMNPAENPSLFQSTLIIIIKDAFESDKAGITREFSLKLREIVEEEKGANFISRLHRGKLDIIPWPVVETKEFYRLFTILKGRLDRKKISHPTAGAFLHTIKTLMAKIMTNDWGALSHTMAKLRAKTLSTLLWSALSTGFAETKPQLVPLKDLDADLILENHDTTAIFAISDGVPVSRHNIEMDLTALLGSWSPSTHRQSIPDSDWVAELVSHIDALVSLRANHVRSWLGCNLRRFEEGNAAVGDLRRRFDDMVIELRMNVQLCCAQCASCNLLCIRSRSHEGEHCCSTNHKCTHICGFCEDDTKPCGTRAGHAWNHICAIPVHRCGEPCKLFGRSGCLEYCTKDQGHTEEDHMCPTPVHMCGEPCALQGMMLPGGKTHSCQERCSIPIGQAHVAHSCDSEICPLTCELCKRRCDGPHLHGLSPGEHHLCGETHNCLELCEGQGVCQIDSSPLSNQATFTGRHETFQYTKYTQGSKRLKCVKSIPRGRTSHEGSHTHSEDSQPFHFCDVRCANCRCFCTLPMGHPQKEHETSHGSMTQTRWAVDGPDGTALELGGRKFSSSDEGGPVLCNFVCTSMGRHVHIDYCPTERGGRCDDPEVEHINEKITPDPNRPKDATTHSLHWRRMDFKDPYTRDEQKNFAKCDAMCPGPEHSGTAAGTGQPSYCTLPMFHPLRDPNDSVNGLGYISTDGHQFECDNPSQAFHVIFVIDRSGSMSTTDICPRPRAQMTELIQQTANNRLGAVYSALYGFWSSRHHTVAAGRQAIGARRDAYSIILFDGATTHVLINDFTRTPDQLLAAVLRHQTGGGTDFTVALRAGQNVMEQNWSTERAPVMIFLSDGEGEVSETDIPNLCHTAVRLGMPLSFHTVSFGPGASSDTLREMTKLAHEIQNNAPRDPQGPLTVLIPSSFSDVLDSDRLAETFVGFAESLRKPRGSLMR